MKRQYWLMALVILVSSAMSVSAKADVSGIWRGYGEWTYEGSSVPCQMAIQYEETATVLKRVKGFFNCSLVALHSDPIAWVKQGSDLLLDGKKAGTIVAQAFEATEEFNNDGGTVTTKFSIDNNGRANYSEVWRDKKGAEIYLIRGSFKKSRD